MEMAERNVDFAFSSIQRVQLILWNAKRLPVRSGTVDCIICDLPFGYRLGTFSKISQDYPYFIREMARVLVPNGKCLLLVMMRKAIESAAARYHLEVEEVREVRVSGLVAYLISLKKPPPPVDV